MDFNSISNEIHKETLHALLPLVGYKGIVVKTESLDSGFSALIRLNIETKEDALQWLSSFQDKSQLRFRVERTHSEDTQRLIFKKEYHCFHNSRPKRFSKPRKKHLRCNAKLTLTVKRRKMKKSKDIYLKAFPCEVLLRHNHNHPIYCSPTLKVELPTDEPEEEYIYIVCDMPSDVPAKTEETYKIEIVSDRVEEVIEKEKPVEKDYNGVCRQLERFVTIVMTKYENNFEKYHEPISRFLENFASCKTDASFINALNTFGKYNREGAPQVRAGRNIQVRNMIVQPATIFDNDDSMEAEM